MQILRYTGSKFCVKFERAPVKFQTNSLTHKPQNFTVCVIDNILELWRHKP